MTSLHDPLTLPNGQVLPNRIMKAALSEALGNKQTPPTAASSGCTRPGAEAGTAC